MIQSASRDRDFSAHLGFWLLSAFLVLLWLAGGASRADVLGQAVTRFFAWSFLIAFVLLSPQFEWRRVKPVALIVALSVAIVALQLVPLPPALWSALPGREILVKAAEVSGQPQPWRPVSISPSASANALGSLVVPVTVLVLAANLTHALHWRMCGLILALIFLSCIPALLQVSGARFENSLINQVAGSVSGNFANRNHFALFLALGCLIAPVWGLRGGTNRRRAIVALALVPFFLLTLLATGSRAGLALGAIALVLAIVIERAALIRRMRALDRLVRLSLLAAVALILAAPIAVSIMFGRAIAVDRALSLGANDDLRSRAIPYVLDAAGRYFPFGSGFGTFDQTYRIAEPDALLRLVYFNHAHNDWLEIVLTGGIAGAMLLGGGLVWFATATCGAWREGGSREFTTLARVGAAGLFLVMIASLVDYPARTPMVMGIVTIAAIWLHLGSQRVPKR
jgi:O-antigen ligase